VQSVEMAVAVRQEQAALAHLIPILDQLRPTLAVAAAAVEIQLRLALAEQAEAELVDQLALIQVV
jgi:hypothetical protein